MAACKNDFIRNVLGQTYPTSSKS